jgi:hypothetical protein
MFYNGETIGKGQRSQDRSLDKKAGVTEAKLEDYEVKRSEE